MVTYGVTWPGKGVSGVPCSQHLMALSQLVFVPVVGFSAANLSLGNVAVVFGCYFLLSFLYNLVAIVTDKLMGNL